MCRLLSEHTPSGSRNQSYRRGYTESRAGADHVCGRRKWTCVRERGVQDRKCRGIEQQIYIYSIYLICLWSIQGQSQFTQAGTQHAPGWCPLTSEGCLYIPTWCSKVKVDEQCFPDAGHSICSFNYCFCFFTLLQIQKLDCYSLCSTACRIMDSATLHCVTCLA